MGLRQPLSKFDRNRRYALSWQRDVEFKIFLVAGPGLWFLPQSGSLGELFDLEAAQIFRLAHPMPEGAWVRMILVDAFNPRYLGRGCVQETQMNQFGMNRMSGHREIRDQDRADFSLQTTQRSIVG